MSGSILCIVAACLSLMPLTSSPPQAIPVAAKVDPYSNFVGDWSGRAILNPDNEPPAVTLHISEETNRSRMRWDYTFGRKGEKGYKKATKWIVLKPAETLMISQWKGHEKVYFATTRLDIFSEKGLGTFIALDASREHPIGTYRCAFTLEPETLSYF